MAHYKLESETEPHVTFLKRQKGVGRPIAEIRELSNMTHPISEQKKKNVKELLRKQFGEEWKDIEELKWYDAILEKEYPQKEGKEEIEDEIVCICCDEDGSSVHI